MKILSKVWKGTKVISYEIYMEIFILVGSIYDWVKGLVEQERAIKKETLEAIEFYENLDNRRK